MVTEADWSNWTVDDLRPYVDTALECFGPERCIFGSDWPVCNLAATYSDVVNALRECIGELSETERSRIMGRNAVEFYRLPE